MLPRTRRQYIALGAVFVGSLIMALAGIDSFPYVVAAVIAIRAL